MALFNSQTAREMQAKSVLARTQRDDAALQSPPAPQPEPAIADGYVQSRLERVRKHIEDTDQALSKASDPLDRERLSRALGVLMEAERKLAGRPDPGSFKPVQGRKAAVLDMRPL